MRHFIPWGWGFWKAAKRIGLALFLDKALLMLPADAGLHLLKGVLALGRGRYESAARELRHALTGGESDTPGAPY